MYVKARTAVPAQALVAECMKEESHMRRSRATSHIGTGKRPCDRERFSHHAKSPSLRVAILPHRPCSSLC